MHKKLESLIPVDGTLVETVEQMTEYLYHRRQRKLEGQHNGKDKALISPQFM